MGFEDDHLEKHYDGSVGVGLKIMLAAAFSLFFFLLFVILFHLFLRRRLRIRLLHQQQQQQLHQISVQIAPFDLTNPVEPNRKPGLDPSVIASLPKLPYKRTERFKQAQSSIECSVCLVTILEDANVTVLPKCNHMFHVDCVDKWFGSNTTCPICRTVVEIEPGLDREGPVQLQPTAPPAWERSLRRDHSSDGSATVADIERL